MTMSVLGLFRYEEDCLNAARSLKTSGHGRISLMSPIPLHEAFDVLELGVSPVRRFSLLGAIAGAISGFALATACALVFILPTGGRAIIAFPPFLVITYEMTILIGVLSTLLAFHVISGLPAWRDAPYRIEVIVDRFSVAVECDAEEEKASVERVLREAGADEVQRVEIP